MSAQLWNLFQMSWSVQLERYLDSEQPNETVSWNLFISRSPDKRHRNLGAVSTMHEQTASACLQSSTTLPADFLY